MTEFDKEVVIDTAEAGWNFVLFIRNLWDGYSYMLWIVAIVLVILGVFGIIAGVMISAFKRLARNN